VTVSIGAGQARGSALPEQVVKAADKALYRAKEGGRNRVAL
jgi:PleD family two-component response regulator